MLVVKTLVSPSFPLYKTTKKHVYFCSCTYHSVICNTTTRWCQSNLTSYTSQTGEEKRNYPLICDHL